MDGFAVATVAALAGSYCVCWVSMAVEKLKEAPVLGTLERGLVFLRTSQPGDLCDPCGRLVYPLADHASAYDAASIVALRVNCALRLRYWIGVRDQEGVTKAV